MNPIEQTDPAVWEAIAAERRRQQNGLEMIASENYTSPAVLAAQGSVLTNKYAEGYPGRRYYGGCEHVDVVEKLAIERALKLFGAEHANVQPHSGAQANMAVYFACLEPGETILAMNLSHGGHLTHGMHLNFSGKLYKVIHYGVRRDDERIDFDQVAALAREHRPKLIVAGASAYARVIDFSHFAEICRETQALLMVDMAHIAGLVAGDQHPSPVPWSDFVTSTTHKTLRGPARRLRPVQEGLGRKGQPVGLPRHAGWAAYACHRGQGYRFPRGASAELPRVCRPDRGQCPHACPRVASAELPPRIRRHRQPPCPGGRHLARPDREGGREGPRRGGHHRQPQRHPLRTRPPLDPSGIRIGTPALTTRGMRETEMRQIAGWIGDVFASPDDSAVRDRVRGQVAELCQQFPAPADAIK